MSNHLLSHFCSSCRKTRRMPQQHGVLTCPKCWTERRPARILVPDLPVAPAPGRGSGTDKGWRR